MGVLFGLSLIKYFKYFLRSILGKGKLYVEGKIVGLVLVETNGEPLDRDLS